MKKLKIYLDTSVISHLDASDALREQADTRKLWLDITDRKYEVCISPIVMIELDGCTEPKRSKLLERLGKISFIELDETDEVLTLAAQYLEAGIYQERVTEIVNISPMRVFTIAIWLCHGTSNIWLITRLSQALRA